MIAAEFKPLIIDFIDEADKIPNLVTAILYGSATTGDISKKSDIDVLLLFDAPHDPESGEESNVAHRIASDIVKKHKSERSFSFVFGNAGKRELDADFIWETARDGMVIWAKLSTGFYKPELKAMLLVSYSMEELLPKDKMAVHRALYGYRVEKVVGKKRYVNASSGFMGKYGKKIGGGVLLVPAEKSADVIELFKKHNVKYKETKVWQ
jgi:predicted nucleotidyltransferase